MDKIERVTKPKETQEKPKNRPEGRPLQNQDQWRLTRPPEKGTFADMITPQKRRRAAALQDAQP
jgi:hypothetical protein